MAGEAGPWARGGEGGGLSSPDIQGPTELADEGGVLEHEGDRLHESNERARQHRMDDVVGDRLDVREAMVGRHVHQLVLSHPDLAGGIPEAASEGAHRPLEHDLRVPEVGFEEEDLTARLEEAVDVPEIEAVGVVTEDGGADDVVEALGGQVAPDVGDMDEARVGKRLARGRLPQVPVEDRRGDERLSSKHRRQMPGPEAAAGAEIQDRLAGKHVEGVAHREGSPPELDGRGCGVAKPVRLAATLHLPEILLEAHGSTR